MNSLRAKILHGRVTYKVDDLLRITKQMVVFVKGNEQTYSTEIFRVVKVISRVQKPVYELSDLQNRLFEGRFYNYELVKVTVSPDTEIQIDKVVRTRNKNCINTSCHVERLRRNF